MSDYIFFNFYGSVKMTSLIIYINYIMNFNQNMWNMMNNYMNNMNQIFNPVKTNDHFKKKWINENIFQTSAGGQYRKCPFSEPSSTKFCQLDPDQRLNICDVLVVNEHVLDVAEQYVQKGNAMYNDNYQVPVVLNVVGNDFMGTGFESSNNIRDEIINIRTNFCLLSKSKFMFPLKEDECLYNKNITVIRPKMPFNLHSPDNLYRVSMISATPIMTLKLTTDNKMFSSDLIKTTCIIECIFQTAINHDHKILILQPFGHDEDNNPIDEIIKIYNLCIMKYGTYFNKIIIGVPPHYDHHVFKQYNDEIIRPANIVKHIDIKYEQNEMKNMLLQKTSNQYNEENEENNNKQMEMFKMFMNMMNKN